MFAPAEVGNARTADSLGRSVAAGLILGLVLPALGWAAEPIWQDEFNQPAGTGPDPVRWAYDLGNGVDGWGNAEKERYTDSRRNAVVVDDPDATDGKALVIRAEREPGGGFTSARIKTAGKAYFRYGHLEARLKLPLGQGLWPAFWLLGRRVDELGWPAGGEIDIMEMVGRQPGTTHGTLHGPGYSGDAGLHGLTSLPGDESFHAAYHVFSLDWAPGKITWSLDGRPFFTRTAGDVPPGSRWVFDDDAYFLILNLAVGGHWPGDPDATTKFPQELRVDYVRVFADPLAPVPTGG
ncbi:MAG TPA: glycoside hydrolase family 16 protein [Lacunisphaera sp.]|nr:glycoside hydrolase family 16 protein [Lacunisphaera sp.]